MNSSYKDFQVHKGPHGTALLSLKHLALSGFSFDIKRSTELPFVCGVCFRHYQDIVIYWEFPFKEIEQELGFRL